MNPLDRFSDRAQAYAAYRPSYPQAAISTLLANLGDPNQLTAADIGAGTGISARLLGDRGLQVWAIEPNAAMRSAAAPHARVRWLAGQATATGLPDQAVDLVTCCQAFHWFEAEPSLQEFQRILQPHGRLALMWNDRDSQDAFTQAYRSALAEIVGDRPPSDPSHRALAVVAQSPRFTDWRSHQFTYRQTLDQAGLLGRTFSSSYVPNTGAPGERVREVVQTLWQQYAVGDRVQLVYRTSLYLTEVVHPSSN